MRKLMSKLSVLILSFLMVFSMIPGMALSAYADTTLSGSGTEDDPYVISSAEEFAAMPEENSGKYFQLTDDITVSTPYANDFAGVFDGDNHTVTLAIEADVNYTGLFRAVKAGSVVKNLVTAGSVSITGNRSYTGAVAASLEGGTIENCRNEAAVSSYKAVGGIAGRALDGSNIRACSNYGAITGSNNQIGGITGNTDYAVNITDCYNSGTVTGFNMTGGIIGQASRSSSVDALTNCYNVGTISITSTNTDYGAISGNKSNSGTRTNCYMLDTSAPNPVGGNTSIDGVTSKTSEEMKADAFLTALGDAFESDQKSINNGYPVLAWENIDDTAPKATVTFTVTPADSTIKVDKKKVDNAQAQVKAGSHTYAVSCEGYKTVTGTFEVTQEQAESGDVIELDPITLPELESITLNASKTEFETGDALTGLTVTAHYADESEVEVTDYTTDWDSSQPAEGKTVTVTYQGKTATFEVNITLKPSALTPILGKMDVDLGSSTLGWDDDASNGWLVSNNQGKSSSSATMTMTAKQAGLFSFKYKVSSEARYDGLTVKVGDTTILNKVGGEIDWTEQSMILAQNDVVTFTYSKDSSGDNGSDSAWVKDLSLAPAYTVTLTTVPENAALVLKDSSENEVTGTNGVYTVTDGTYTYTASAFGYEDKTGTIEVDGENVTQTIELTKLPSYEVTFDITMPEGHDASQNTITVKSGDVTMTPDDTGKYDLPVGSYTYTIRNPQCATVTGEFEVTDSNKTIEVTLEHQGSILEPLSGNVDVTLISGNYGFAEDTENRWLVTNNQGISSSSAVMTMTAKKAGTLTFSYKVGSEARYDTFTLKKGDDTLVNAVSGEIDWTELSVELAKDDVLTFTYYKDTSTNSNGDSVWLKELSFAGEPEDPEADLAAVTAAKTAFDNELGALKPNYNSCSNIVELVQSKVDEYDGCEGVTVSLKSSDTPTVIPESGNIFYNAGDLSPYGMNSTNVSCVFTFTKNSQSVDSKSRTAIVGWDQTYYASKVDAEAETLTFDMIKGENASADEITTALTLPQIMTSSARTAWGSITWSSSNTDIIAIESTGYGALTDPMSGVITAPAEDTVVTLTATFGANDGNLNSNVESAAEISDKLTKKTVSFDVTVKAAAIAPPTPEELLEILNRYYTDDLLKDFVSGETLDKTAVTGDIQLPRYTTIKDDNNELVFENKEIAVTSGNESVIKINGYRAAVDRFAVTEPTDVDLIVTFTRRGVSASKTITLTVQPVSETEIATELELIERAKAAYFDGIKGENSDKDNVTENLHPFQEMYVDDSNNIQWVYNYSDITGTGVIPDGYWRDDQSEEMEASGYNKFKSSDISVVTHENLLVTRDEANKKVTITSWLSSEKFRDAAAAHPDNEDLQKLYKQEVSVEIRVKGTKDPLETLNALIVEAEELYGGMTEGDGPGQYEQGTKEELRAAIDSAKAVAENDEATDEEKEEAIDALTAALAAAKAKRNPSEATVTVVTQKEKNTLGFVYENIKVKSNEAAKYGYTKPEGFEDKVTLIDACAAVHEKMFGEAFTAAPEDYLKYSSSGYVTRIFGLTTSSCMMLVNGKSKEYPDRPGTGSVINDTEIEDNDYVNFFLMGSDFYVDKYLSFGTHAIKSYIGEDVTVNVKGNFVLGGMEGMGLPAGEFNVEDAVVAVKDASGSTVATATTDEDGNATFQVSAAGEYTVTVTSIPEDDEEAYGEDAFVAPYAKLTVREATGFLKSVVINKASRDKTSDVREISPEFDPESMEYTVDLYDFDATVYAWAELSALGEGATVYAKYTNQNNAREMSTKMTPGGTSGTSITNFMKSTDPADGTVLTLEVTKGDVVQTYTFTSKMKMRTLSALEASVGGKAVSLDQPFVRTDTDYTMTVLDSVSSVDLTPTAAFPALYTLKVDGKNAESGSAATVDLGDDDTKKINIEIAKEDSDIKGKYTITVKRVAPVSLSFNVTPEDAIISVYDKDNYKVPAEDGRFMLVPGAEYKYMVTKNGYVGTSDTISIEENTVRTVALEEAAANPDIDTSITAAWPSFRGNEYNNGVTSAKTPEKETANLRWSKKGGSGWSAAPTVQLIVDDCVVYLSGNTINKISRETGETVASGTLVSNSAYSYITPIYKDGVIYCALTGGTVQAVNAKTLESLWVYKDPLGGQDQVPVYYSDGYIYTGYWNSETGNANYVCLSATDEDPTRGDERKVATWTYTSKGGFYWAGAVARGDYLVFGTDDGTSGSTGPSSVLVVNKYTGEVLDRHALTGDQRSTISYDSESGRFMGTTKGGYIFTLKVNEETGKITDFAEEQYAAASTSTPLIYKGVAYYGVTSGSNFSGRYSVIAVDANTLEKKWEVEMLGYPQCSGLLSTAYEEETGYINMYFTYNNNPGGITMLKARPDCSDSDEVIKEEVYDAAGFEQYCICSPICDQDGTIFYKNDSGNILAVERNEAYLADMELFGGDPVLNTEFKPGTLSYEAAVDPGTDSVKLKLVAADGAEIKVNGIAANNGNATVDMYNGAGKAEIEVLNGSAKRLYTIDIREKSEDASLKMILVNESNSYGSGKELTPAFDPDIKEYVQYKVTSSRSFENLWPDAADPAASVKVYAVYGVKPNYIDDPETGEIEQTAVNNGHGRYAIYFLDKTVITRIEVTSETGYTDEYYVTQTKQTDAAALAAEIKAAMQSEINAAAEAAEIPDALAPIAAKLKEQAEAGLETDDIYDMLGAKDQYVEQIEALTSDGSDVAFDTFEQIRAAALLDAQTAEGTDTFSGKDAQIVALAKKQAMTEIRMASTIADITDALEELKAIIEDADSDAEKAVIVDAAKAAAQAELDAVDTSVYDEPEKAVVDDIIAQAKAAIAEAGTVEDVNSILADALAAIDDVMTAEEKAEAEGAEALAEAKADALEALDALVDPEKLLEEDVDKAEIIVLKAKSAVEKAKTTDEVAEILEAAQASVKALEDAKTEADEEAAAEEAKVAQAKEDAIAELDAVDTSVYDEPEKAVVDDIIAQAKEAIGEADTTAEIDSILADALDAIDDVMTAEEKAEAEGAEALAEAKAEALETLDALVDPEKLLEEDVDKAEIIVLKAKSAVEKAKTTDEVAELLEAAQASVKALEDAKTEADEEAAAEEAELAQAKEDALAELDKMAEDLTAYRDEEKATIEAMIEEAKEAVENAESVNEIEDILEATSEDIADIPTDAELTQGELEEAKEAALEELAKIDPENYNDPEAVAAAIESAMAAISNAENLDAVGAAIDTFENTINVIPTKDDAASTAKKEAFEKLSKLVPDNEAKMTASEVAEAKEVIIDAKFNVINAVSDKDVNAIVAAAEAKIAELTQPNDQPMKAKAVKKSQKVKKAKVAKKAVTIKGIKVTGAQGKVTYKISGNKKSKKALKFNTKTKKIKVKKGTKKGKYTLKIKVTAAGNAKYLSGSKTVTIKVTVK